MKFSKTQLLLGVALLVSNATILFSPPEWFWLRVTAALALTFVLSGWAWLPTLNWLQTNQAIERLMLLIGASSLLTALVLLVTVLLPGPFTETPVLIALNLTILLGLIAQWVRPASPTQMIEWPTRRVLLILVAIMAVAACTRFIRLGYGEFHEDALENMRLIVQAYKGEEFAPFIDSKGPIHWLLPAALWYLNGWLTEGLARAPFAVTALALIPTMYGLGRRMSRQDSVGLLAAALVALNGFFVAYARFVENPSLIVFWGALAMWLAYRYYQEAIPQFLLWLALTLAIGLIAHFDVLLYLPVFAFIVALKLYQQPPAQRQWGWVVAAGGLFVVVVSLFYVPYFTDPNIGLVRQYFVDDRIGQALFYNRVHNLFDQDQLYSTRYHAPILSLLLTWLLARNFAQWGRWGLMLLAILAVLIISTVALPELWLIGNLNLAFIPYAALTLAVLALPKTSIEIKFLFLWLAIPLGALLFLAKDAADHIQIAYTAWALLAAFALVDLWNFLGQLGKLSPAIRNGLKSTLVVLLTLAAGLILYYQYLVFLSTVTHYWAVKNDYTVNANSVYGWLYGSIARPRKIFSNPRLVGWKAVGYLWATGTLNGDFRSINESFAVPIWYTFQTPRSCYEDPQNYWIRRDWEGWPAEEQNVLAQGYTLTRVVLVDQEPMLNLYQKQAPPGQPEIIDLEAYRHKFDLLATPGRFAAAEVINQPASLNFGDALLLQGYNLPTQTSPGTLLPVTLFWQSLAPMATRYRAFVHLVDANGTRWSQHDDDPACRLLTTDMRPGQKASRQFRLPIDPATPPGAYNIVLGIYHPDSLERLNIWDNTAGQSPGNSVVLGQVQVE